MERILGKIYTKMLWSYSPVWADAGWVGCCDLCWLLRALFPVDIMNCPEQENNFHICSVGCLQASGSGWKLFTDNSSQHLHLATDFGGSFWLFSSMGAGNIGLRWSRVYLAKAIWCRVDSNLGWKQESQHLLFICSYWQRLLVSYQTYPEHTTMSTSSFPCPRGQLDDRQVEWKSQGWLWSSFEAHMDFAYLVWVWKIHGRYMAMCWA